MTNRISGDRSVDWLRWLHERNLIETEEALHEALARVVDLKMEQLRAFKDGSNRDDKDSGGHKSEVA